MTCRSWMFASTCWLASMSATSAQESRTVELQFPIDGVLERVHVKANARVKKGELLFELDGQLERIQFERSQANFAQAEALFQQARAELLRADRLLLEKAIGADEHAKILARHVTANVHLVAKTNERETAKLKLEVTKLYAPFDGVIAPPLMKIGDFLKAKTPVATLVVAAEDAAPVYDFILKKPADKIEIVSEKDQTIFVIRCPSGIGGGSIKLKSGSWPENVVLRFQHGDKKGFTNLEKIVLTTDRLQIEGNLKSSGKFDVHFRNAKGKPGKSAGVLVIPVERRPNGIEVTLPANLLLGTGQVELSWVNEFRR